MQSCANMNFVIFLIVHMFDLTLTQLALSHHNNIRAKRSEVNLQTCISSFDVHKDKIIRTQDSRDMGAKYLNEIDLGSREECLRLCCETENCDVFVFEEKNSGSCYLFNCGPPEDFKCKFTHHVNYTSAVLTINRHVSDLESQIKLTKHEQDLARLRKPESPPENQPETKITLSTTSSSVKMKGLDDGAKTKTKIEEKERKCSRYQFECRSTSECIAIYNACDGIPQCADGSDEAIELGCPEMLTSTIPVQDKQNVPPANINVRYNQNSLPRLQAPLQEAYHTQVRPEDHKTSPYDTQQLPMYDHISSHHVQAQGSWIPHQSNQMPQIPTYDKSIFNHKENGLQMVDGQETSQNQYGEVNNNGNPRDYSKVSNYYDDSYHHNGHQQWPNKIQDVPYNNDYVQDAKPSDEWIRQNIQLQESSKDADFKAPPQGRFKNWNSEDENRNIVQDKVSHPNNGQKSKVDLEKQKRVQNQSKHAHVVAYKLTDDLQDGVAETPSGAILSLTFGLIILCVMAVLIGCRLRVVRRKMRKGGKMYAHDADYLVNGMYL